MEVIIHAQPLCRVNGQSELLTNKCPSLERTSRICADPVRKFESIYPARRGLSYALVERQEITDYFSNRYGGGRKQWTREGKQSLLKDGSYAEKTSHFRAEVAARAGELLGRKARAGIDYVLTEVVHCKSKAETGVKEARDECVARYLS